jgi:organic radical activating enzyme
MKESRLSVSEVFYSIQGEGKTMGYPSVFVRLGGCNLMCGGMGTQNDKELYNDAKWRCDTIEVWMKSKSKIFSEILGDKEINAIKNGAHLIMTGGEPLMQQKNLVKFIDYVKENINENVFVEIETNGTIIPNDETLNAIDLFNCSPKTKNSGNDKSITYNKKAIQIINDAKDSIFKFVINTNEDFEEMKNDYAGLIDRDKIWLMPAGENQELLNLTKKNVSELCIKNNLKFTTRLHIEIWNQKTGV